MCVPQRPWNDRAQFQKHTALGDGSTSGRSFSVDTCNVTKASESKLVLLTEKLVLSPLNEPALNSEQPGC